MTYHYRKIAVKEKVRCTLEKAIGLTDAERELIHFGSAPFKPHRSDRWPAEIKARRAKVLNNLKNARALAALASSTSKQRAQRLSIELAAIAGEARSLHAEGARLAEKTTTRRSRVRIR
jgi:hypothetical protein